MTLLGSPILRARGNSFWHDVYFNVYTPVHYSEPTDTVGTSLVL